MRCCSRGHLWGWNGERMEGVRCVCEALCLGCVYWVVGVYIFAMKRFCAKDFR